MTIAGQAAPANATPAAPPLPLPAEASPQIRRRALWLGLLTIWAYVACFMQFGLLDYYARPASQRVNNGRQATFFAVHINPYYVFSEDFHLYVVRSKRIMDRGWTDSPLRTTADSRPSYVAPLQAALMMVAVSTDGRPVPYALFMCSVLLVAWSMLYVAALWWLPDGVSPLTAPIAVLVTLLFESVSGLIHPFAEFAQWPVHRGLRLSTMAWSSPLALSLLLATVSLVFRPQRSTGRLIFVVVGLCILATADNWAFLLAAACTGTVVGILGMMWIAGRKRFPRALRCFAGLTGALVISLALHRATSVQIGGNVLTRGGFGPVWQQSPMGLKTGTWLKQQLFEHALVLPAILLLASLYVAFKQTAPRRYEIGLNVAPPTSQRWHLACLFAVPLVSITILVALLTLIGMEEYHSLQFKWRSEFILLFGLIVVACECAKWGLRQVLADRRRSNRWELAAVVLILGALFVYHNVRIRGFVRQTAAREFFLTQDEEGLRDWLRQREPALGRYTLATASHELNYLCAYWSRADLLLPEGFPYHSGLSTPQIEQAMADVLAVYGATPQSWRDFNLYHQVWDQWSWGRSRLLSARHGYMYYLLHRQFLENGYLNIPPEFTQPKRTTAHLADQRLWFDAHAPEVFVTRACRESAERIAQIVERQSAESGKKKSDRPDVVIVDEVSRALGTPDLSGYVREFQHGNLEAWVLASRGTAPPKTN
ncbi:MAG: hypothetical protein K8T25_19170 [Planctomycetia bacterium]|nr:hypothetical protein [Planctomycetia bacterium]